MTKESAPLFFREAVCISSRVCLLVVCCFFFSPTAMEVDLRCTGGTFENNTHTHTHTHKNKERKRERERERERKKNGSPHRRLESNQRRIKVGGPFQNDDDDVEEEEEEKEDEEKKVDVQRTK